MSELVQCWWYKLVKYPFGPSVHPSVHQFQPTQHDFFQQITNIHEYPLSMNDMFVTWGMNLSELELRISISVASIHPFEHPIPSNGLEESYPSPSFHLIPSSIIHQESIRVCVCVVGWLKYRIRLEGGEDGPCRVWLTWGNWSEKRVIWCECICHC